MSGPAIGIPYAPQVVEGLAHSLQPGSSRTAYVASVAGVGHRDQLRVGHFRVRRFASPPRRIPGARNCLKSLSAKENGHVARGFVVQRETVR